MAGRQRPVVDMSGKVDLYVPAAGAVMPGGQLAGVKLGSAIVGENRQDQVAVYYEGNLHGSTGLDNYAERAYIAAGRMRARYPTVARRIVDAGALRYIGQLDLDRGEVSLEVEPEEIASWVDLSDEEQLVAVSVKRHLEHRLGQAMMRQPAKYAGLAPRLMGLKGREFTKAMTEAALAVEV